MKNEKSKPQEKEGKVDEIDNIRGTFIFDHDNQEERYEENPNFGKPLPSDKQPQEKEDGVREEGQEFEKYPKLADIILWFAMNVKCPGTKWNTLLQEINTALYTSAVTPPHTSAGGEAKCMCEDIEIGSYGNQVELPAPQFMKVHLLNRGQNTDTVCVDACLKNEILSLWGHEIMTTGCCCGHNKQAGYIGVYRIGDVRKMKELGYVLLPDHEETFYPKSLPPQSATEPQDADQQTARYREALEGLLSAIPKQDNDHDWWPDELTTAVALATEALSQ